MCVRAVTYRGRVGRRVRVRVASRTRKDRRRARRRSRTTRREIRPRGTPARRVRRQHTTLHAMTWRRRIPRSPQGRVRRARRGSPYVFTALVPRRRRLRARRGAPRIIEWCVRRSFRGTTVPL